MLAKFPRMFHGIASFDNWEGIFTKPYLQTLKQSNFKEVNSAEHDMSPQLSTLAMSLQMSVYNILKKTTSRYSPRL